MTLPSERARAIDAAREMLVDLMTPSRTPGVPKEIRARARSVLKHFPPTFAVRGTYDALDTPRKSSESTADWFWKRTKSRPGAQV